MKKTKYVKRILMCKPTHFSVDYVINPWMQIGTVDKKKAYIQWNAIGEALTNLDIRVDIIDQKRGLPDMVFAADQALIKNRNLVLSNFHVKERKKEVAHYKKWFEKQNFEICQLPYGTFFEGSGECVWYGETLFVGSGFRNSDNVAEPLSRLLGVEVICLELINPRFYHLDTCFFPLNERIAFYYPPAFSPKSREILEKRIMTLLPLSKKEVHNFAANSLVTDHHVIMQKGNIQLKNQLRDFGYTTVELDVSEFMKAGGGIHCLVQTLEEEYA
jgi:N-dimethylarginine dimethylaminohydrolase